MQSSYSHDMAVGVAGGRADNRPCTVVSRNNPSVAVPFGVAVCKHTNDDEVKLPTTAAEAAAAVGVAMHTQSIESSSSGDPQYPEDSDVSVMTKGPIWVEVEDAVTPASPVYVRYANGIIDTDFTQKGAFRGSPDGVARVLTLTPTAANDTLYSVSIFDHDGALLAATQVLSDASATATEICNALRTGLGSPSGITLGGTDTLTLTAASPGETFSAVSSGPGVIAIAETAAGTASAAELKGAKFASTAAAGGLAQLELNLPA